jgi:hypothetical protein
VSPGHANIAAALVPEGGCDMKTFFAGLALFSLLLGFLGGANNAGAISGALVGGLGLLATLASLSEKIKIDRTPFTDTRDGSSGQRGTQLRDLAGSLGGVLITITLGFGGGFWLGVCASDSTIRRLAEPWPSGAPPARFDEALGWMAMAEKMQKAGLTQRQIERVYRDYHMKEDAKAVAAKAGAAAIAAPAPAPAPATPPVAPKP